MFWGRLLRRKKLDTPEEVLSDDKSHQDRPISPLKSLEGYSGPLKLASGGPQDGPISSPMNLDGHPELSKSASQSPQGGPISPPKNPNGHPGLSKLASELRANYLQEGATGNQKFLPNDKLGELVTKKRVLLALQETTIEQQYHEDLASWVLKSGTRLFSILVLLTYGSAEQLSWLKEFRNDGISDNALPLDFSNTKPYYGYSSTTTQGDGAQKFYSFKTWQDNDLILFDSYQWTFLAPILGSSNEFCHQLSSEQPLPFITLSQKPVEGILGKTLYGKIHPAHIDPQCLSILGMNDPEGIPVFIKLVHRSDNLSQFFDINTGKFKAVHPIISPRRIRPIAAYNKNDNDFVIFRWVDGDNQPN
ncbi:putative protein kinase domain-containing protein [Rosellinia necatrix]|uniref:Uncharacterized protein n=1 Tax=Rosellinia necatrix TaxID=77044 RepID=A0A1W2TW36_ROSNE|nr:putative protein kinase domain-containing protein [Rosellinia necatrix]